MSKQNGGEIFNIIQTWIASGKCPKAFRMTVTNQLDEKYEKLIDAFIESRCGGLYNSTNLDLAAVFLLLDSEYKARFVEQEQRWKSELAEREWQKRVKEVTAWVQAHPNCKQDDEALAVIRDYFTKNPNATIQDWDAYCAQHPDDSRLWVKPQPLNLVAMVKAIKAKDKVDYETQLASLRGVYGDVPVQAALDELSESMRRGLEMETWRESPEDKKSRYAKEEAEAKERQRLATEKIEQKMKYAAEAIVDRFQGKSHSESFRVRDILRDILVHKSDNTGIDWKTTAVKRAQYVANYESKNPSVINNLAR